MYILSLLFFITTQTLPSSTPPATLTATPPTPRRVIYPTKTPSPASEAQRKAEGDDAQETLAELLARIGREKAETGEGAQILPPPYALPSSSTTAPDEPLTPSSASGDQGKRSATPPGVKMAQLHKAWKSDFKSPSKNLYLQSIRHSPIKAQSPDLLS